MTLTVEDGTNVANADSLVTCEEIRDYAAKRGKSFPTSDEAGEPFARQAMDYMEAQRARYKGTKTYPDQSLQFPREGMTIDDIDIPNDVIPVEAKRAQIVLSIEAANGTDLQPTSVGQFVIEDTVGPVTTKYSERVGTTAEPEITSADALLAPLFNVGGGFTLRTVRI